jgi:hypothetical protein
MKKTNKVKIGPLGTPLGNPLAYFNSLKGKPRAEPKQTLRKAQNGTQTAGQDLMAEKRNNTISQMNSLQSKQDSNRQQMINSGKDFFKNSSTAFAKAKKDPPIESATPITDAAKKDKEAIPPVPATTPTTPAPVTPPVKEGEAITPATPVTDAVKEDVTTEAGAKDEVIKRRGGTFKKMKKGGSIKRKK